jgi:hypothetical protein
VKSELFIILLSFFAFLNVNAQTAETISELTPVPSNIGKFTKRARKIRYLDYSPTKVRFDVKIEPVSVSDGKKAVAINIRTKSSEIIFWNMGGVETGVVNFYGRITSKDKKTDGFFEEKITTTATVEELAEGKVKAVILRKVFELPPGKYQIGVIVRDNVSGAHSVKIIKFQVP